MKNKLSKVEKIIVGIFISLLLVVSIPLSITNLEKVKEATDLSNALIAYTSVYYASKDNNTESPFYAGNGIYEREFDLLQSKNGWSTKGELEVGGITNESSSWVGEPTIGGKVKVIYKNNIISIYWS